MLIVNKMYSPEIGGVEVIVKQIAELNRDLFGKATVLTLSATNNSSVENDNNIHIIRLASIYHRRSIRWSLHYRSEIKKLSECYSTVLYNYPSFQPEFYKSKFGYKKKIVYYHADSTRYGIIGKIYQWIITDRFLSNADKIIVSNPHIIESSAVLKKNRNKCHVLPYGIDTNHYTYRENNNRNKILKDLGIKEGKLILFVGRMNRYKGFYNLIKALNILDEDNKLVVVSTFEFDEATAKYIKEHNLESRIAHYKNVSDEELPLFYSACDVLTMPSTDRAEAFGLVAVEAMACGLPVITTELGTGTSFHNIDGITGRIINPNDIEALADSIDSICENKFHIDKSRIRQRALDFSLDIFVKKWSEQIKELE